jgi:hypothetical protein
MHLQHIIRTTLPLLALVLLVLVLVLVLVPVHILVLLRKTRITSSRFARRRCGTTTTRCLVQLSMRETILITMSHGTSGCCSSKGKVTVIMLTWKRKKKRRNDA